MYRWPDIQYKPPTERTSRKTYDIYGLGLVLLEIAHWKSLGELLSLPKNNLQPSDCASIREALIGNKTGPLEQLRDVAGMKFYSAAHRCIVAHGEAGFGVDANEDQTKVEVGLKLQEAYMTKVVQELNSINI
jgi:hypothetical protein